MEIIENQEGLQQTLRSSRIVLVQFGSERCAPCKALQNKIRTWNQTHPAVCHVYVPVEELPELSAQMEVFTVPAVFVYVEGRLTIRQSGYFSLEQILEQTEKYERLLAPRTRKVAYLQFDVSHDPEKNFSRIETHLQNLDAELLVLPELSLCGYLFPDRKTLMEAAEPVPGGPKVGRMQELSKKHRCAIVFGLAEREGDRIYNTAAVVRNGRYLGKYRKVHLSDLEKTLFDCGTTNAVIDLGDWKLGVQICFDLWFPEISREQLRLGADLLCALGNFGGETSVELARLRAVENLTPMVLCNRIGTERNSEMDAYFLGKSAIWTADGTRIGLQEADTERLERASVEIGTARGNRICRDFSREWARHPLPAEQEAVR